MASPATAWRHLTTFAFRAKIPSGTACIPQADLCRTEELVREWMEEELQRTKPPTDPDLDRAQAILEDFARFWDAEPEPAERRKLILSLFAQVWAKDNRIGAVKPNTAFANYFTAASEVRNQHPKADADDEATKAGATGLEPATSAVTGQRSNQLSYAPVPMHGTNDRA